LGHEPAHRGFASFERRFQTTKSMGQAASSSRHRGADPLASPAKGEQPVVIHNGVRLTKTLANRLALRQAGGDVLATQLAPVDQSVTADIRAAAALSSHVDKDVQVAAEKMIMKSKTLSKALETSRLVNDLLVAREEEELEKIDKLSREILEREAEKYGLDVEKEAESEEARLCGVEEGLVARCYREQAEDPLVCRGLVDSYVKCAFGAHT
jgi:hypothetical protein